MPLDEGRRRRPIPIVRGEQASGGSKAPPRKPPPKRGGRPKPAVPPTYVRGEQATGGSKVTGRQLQPFQLPTSPFGIDPLPVPFRGLSKKERDAQRRLDALVTRPPDPQRDLRDYGFIGASAIESLRESYAQIQRENAHALNNALNTARLEPANPELARRAAAGKPVLTPFEYAEVPEPLAVQAMGALGDDSLAHRAAKDAQVIAENFLPAMIEVGKAGVTDIYNAAQHPFDDPGPSQTWERIIKPTIDEYRKNYGSTDAARQYASAHPLFFLADVAIVAGPASRLPGIAKNLNAGVGVRGSVKESFRPSDPRILNVASGDARGVDVPFTWGRHPLTRMVQRSFDGLSRVNKDRAIIGENVRGGRMQAKLLAKEERRRLAQGAQHARTIKAFSFPDFSTETARTAIYWLAQKPEGMDDRTWLTALLADHQAMKEAPVRYPDVEEGPALQRARAEASQLTSAFYDAIKLRDAHIDKNKLAPLKKEMQSLHGKLQVARTRGDDTIALEAQIKELQTRIDATRGLDVPEISGSPGRDRLAQAFEHYGPEQGATILKWADAWARTASPDDPAGWYNRRFPEASYGGEMPDYFGRPDVLTQRAGSRELVVYTTGERVRVLDGVPGSGGKVGVITETFPDGAARVTLDDGSSGTFHRDEISGEGWPRDADTVDAPIFYSQLKKTIDEKMPEKASPAQIRGLLKEIKAEEIEWSGLDDLLLKPAEEKGLKSLTKPQVQRFLEEKGLRVTEVLRKHPQDLTPDEFSRGGHSQIDGSQSLSTKWYGGGSYSTGGLVVRDGTGYREIVFTLPSQVYGDLYTGGHWSDKNVLAHIRFWEIDDENSGRTLHIDELQSDWHQQGQKQGFKEKPGPELIARRAELQGQVDQNTFVLHTLLEKYELGAQADITALIRRRRTELDNKAQAEMAERYGTTDWPYISKQPDGTTQQVHGPEAARRRRELDELRDELHEADPELQEYLRQNSEIMPLFEANRALVQQIDQIDNPRGVEDAPFKNNRWVDLALKRMFRYAVDEGYDSVSWSTGKIQATRYELYDSLPDSEDYGPDMDDFDPDDHVARSDYEYMYASADLELEPDFPWQDETLPGVDWGDGPPFELEARFHGNVGEGDYGEFEIDVAGKHIYFSGSFDDLVHYPDPDEIPPYTNEDFKWLVQQPWVDDLRQKLEENRDTLLEEEGYNEAVDSARESWAENYESDGSDKSQSLIEAGEDDLSSSGRGVTKFYDEIVTKAAAKLVKPFGATVERSSLWGRHSTEGDGPIGEWDDMPVPLVRLTPELKAAVSKPQRLLQAREGDIKGAVTLLGNERVRLQLFQGDNVTTAIHELGHAFMYDLDGDDLSTVESFVGAKFGEWERPHHEKWANAVERYAMEGKSPTDALKKVFAKLKEWMSLVYRSVEELGTPITPELREVLDKRFGYAGRSAEDIVKYAGMYRGTTDLFGAQLSGAKGKVARLEKAHVRKVARRDVDGLKKRRAELVAARRKTSGEATGADLDAQIERLDEQIERREVIANEASIRRERLLDKRIEGIEKALAATDKHPDAKGKEAALESARYLSQWTESILLEAFGPEREGQFAARRALLPGRLADQGLIEDDSPSTTFVGHRSHAYGVKGSLTPRGPRTQNIGATSATDLRLNKKNELLLYQQGRLLTDPAVIMGHWMKAQSIAYLNEVKAWLTSVGEPIALGAAPKDGYYVVNPKGRSTPEWWKDDNLDMDDPSFLAGLQGYTESFLGRKGADDPLRDPDTGLYYEGVVQVDAQIVEKFFERLGGIQKPPGGVLDLVDVANGLVKTSLIYMNPGYVPANFTGNLIFAGLHQHGFLPHSLYKTAKVARSDKELWDGILAEVGTTPSTALLPEQAPGRGRVTGPTLTAERKVAETASRLADNWPRAAAWYYEARKAGYKTRADQLALIRGTEKTPGDRELVSHRSTEAMVNFDRLHPWEKRIAARIFFVWPWVRGATGWAGHYVKEFPERAAVIAQQARNYEEAGGKGLGALPAFASQFIPLDNDGKIAKIINGTAVSPIGTALELGQTAAAVYRSATTDSPYPRFVSVWDMVNPVLSLSYELAAGVNQYGTPKGLRTLLADNTIGDRTGLIPWFHFAKQMVDPSDDPPSYYLDTGRKAEFNRRFVRFGPQRVDIQKLNALAGEKKKQSAEDYLNEKVAAAEQAWAEIGDPGPLPVDVRRSYAIYVMWTTARDVLQEQLSKQKGYQPKAGKREPTLTLLQEASIKAALAAREFPSIWEEEGVSPKVVAKQGPEGLRHMIRALDNLLFGPKNELDDLVADARREREQKKFEQGP